MNALTISEIFPKLERRNAQDSIRAILSLCQSRFAQGFPVLVNFLYYANAEMRHVFDVSKRTPADESYVQSLMEGDFLLPDGIALALSCFRYENPEAPPIKTLLSYRSMGDSTLPNLNGTDLLPELLSAFREGFGPRATGYFYGSFPFVVEAAAKSMSESSGMPIGFQDGYSPFDFEAFERLWSGPKILFVGLGTPRQEIFCNENAARFPATLAVTVGGFFDFIGGGETRAPEVVRRLRLEWLWRVALNPRKNGRKVAASFKFFPRYFRGFE